MARIRRASIRWISLVHRGANQLAPIYKADDGSTQLRTRSFAKMDDEKGELLCCVWAPDKPDTFGDWADRDTIRGFAHEALRDGVGIDIQHTEVPVGKRHAYIAESFLIQKSDPRFSDLKDYEGNSIDSEGGWGTLIKLESPELRRLYRSGEWQGISMGGVAEFDGDSVRPSKDSQPTTTSSASTSHASATIVNHFEPLTLTASSADLSHIEFKTHTPVEASEKRTERVAKIDGEQAKGMIRRILEVFGIGVEDEMTPDHVSACIDQKWGTVSVQIGTQIQGLADRITASEKSVADTVSKLITELSSIKTVVTEEIRKATSATHASATEPKQEPTHKSDTSDSSQKLEADLAALKAQVEAKDQELAALKKKSNVPLGSSGRKATDADELPVEWQTINANANAIANFGNKHMGYAGRQIDATC